MAKEIVKQNRIDTDMAFNGEEAELGVSVYIEADFSTLAANPVSNRDGMR